MRETHEANADAHQQTLLPITGGSCHKFFYFFLFFVATKVCLPRQIMNDICGSSIIGGSCHKYQKFCRGKHTFVATKDVFCQDETFVVTKRILVAAPANDTAPANDSYILTTKTWQHFTTSSHPALQDAVTLGWSAARVQKVHNSYLHG